MDVFREIEALEMELVDPDTRKNVARLQKLLADEFLEFGSSGMVIRKHDVLSNADFSGETNYQLSNFEFRALGDKHILVTYRSIKSAVEIAYRSSIWVKESGRWKMLHHQSTVVPSVI